MIAADIRSTTLSIEYPGATTCARCGKGCGGGNRPARVFYVDARPHCARCVGPEIVDEVSARVGCDVEVHIVESDDLRRDDTDAIDAMRAAWAILPDGPARKAIRAALERRNCAPY